MNTLNTRLSLERIRNARLVISPAFKHTPQIEFESLSKHLSARVQLKIETLNPIRSFKGRGVETFFDSVITASKKRVAVVCASAGNLGQALAYCGANLGVDVTIFAAHTASPLKIQRMRDLGATVRLAGNDFDEAKTAAHKYADQSGASLIVDSLEIATCEGAATIALEMVESPFQSDTVLVALGNGALASGVALVYKLLSPQTEVIAIQAEAASAMTQSWKARTCIRTESANTIADGIAVRIPIEEVLSDLYELLDDAVTVSEQQIREAMQLILLQTGLMCEPSAAVGIAALLSEPSRFKGKNVSTIICGSNISPTDFYQKTQS
jgi:threonine dehydratase